MKTSKRPLRTAFILILAGLVICFAELAAADFDFTRLDSTAYVDSKHAPEGEFTRISVDTDRADVYICISESGKCEIECHEPEKRLHSVSVRDGVLSISQEKAKWYEEFFFMNLKRPRVTLRLPKAQYESLRLAGSTGSVYIRDAFTFADAYFTLSTGDAEISGSAFGALEIRLSTGDITLADISASSLDTRVSTGDTVFKNVNVKGALSFSASTGKTRFEHVVCADLRGTSTTGSVYLSDVRASASMQIKCSTGGIRLTDCDAETLELSASTGDIEGNLISAKTFDAHASTGKVSCVSSAAGGLCTVRTSTGDIRLKAGKN